MYGYDQNGQPLPPPDNRPQQPGQQPPQYQQPPQGYPPQQYPPNYQQPPQQGYYPPQMPPQQQPPKKKGVPIWLWIIGGIFGLGVIGAAASGGTSRTTVATAIPVAQVTSAANSTTVAGAVAQPTSAQAVEAKATNTPRPVAPSATPRPSATPKPTDTPVPGLNQLVSVKNWDLKVSAPQKPGKSLVWSEFGNKSDSAGIWLVIPIELKNTGTTNFGVNTFDFELKDAKGITYKYSTDLGSYAYSKFKGGQDLGGQVPPGVTVKYFLVFDIAPDASGLELIFRQDKNPRVNLGI